MKQPQNKITHVTQYTPRACVYACLEMACFNAKSQQAIHREMKEHNDDVSQLGEFRQLVRLGIYPQLSPFTRLHAECVQLVTVPSLNLKGTNHRVLIDTREVTTLYDPCKGLKGKKYYDAHLDDLKGFSEVTLLHYCNFKEGGPDAI